MTQLGYFILFVSDCGPVPSRSGYVLLATTPTTHNSRINFTCDTGYTGPPARVWCYNDGKWWLETTGCTIEGESIYVCECYCTSFLSLSLLICVCYYVSPEGAGRHIVLHRTSVHPSVCPYLCLSQIVSTLELENRSIKIYRYNFINL